MALALATLAACGSSGDSARDDALAALDRATDAVGLEAEMAALVGGLPLEPSEEETTTFVTSVEQLDSRAGDLLASADTGEAYDEEIRNATEEIRAAGSDLTAAAEGGAGGLTAARKKAVSDLKGSSEDLRVAAELIGAELEGDNGELSAEDADAVDALVTEIDAAGKAVKDAGEQIATQEEEAAGEEAASSAPSSSSGVCPPGFELVGGAGTAAGGSCQNAAGEQLPPSSGGCPPGQVPVGITGACGRP